MSITKISLLTLLLFLGTKEIYAQSSVTPESALKSYLNNKDKSYQWKIKDSFQLGTVKGYNLLLTSQTWRDIVWVHQLIILVPEKVDHDNALLFITGGKVKDGSPRWGSNNDAFLWALSDMVTDNKAVLAVLKQTPNQPLYGELVEDQLISYTLHNFKKDGDYTWPLLFPMTKSAIRAMDAVQEFSKKELRQKISSFVVSGASKRGWTTWLTGASDKRVAAIAPMVIDVLNMPASLEYQIEVWKEYSIQIEDYVKLEIPQSVNTESGKAITTMVDPYSYRKQLTMPKMLFIGTNDEYWPVDAVKKYFDDIPGDNFIHYVPNAGHGLGNKRETLKALSAFWGNTMKKGDRPLCDWEVNQTDSGASLEVTVTPDKLVGAYLWYTDSRDRDFRDEHWSFDHVEKGNTNTINTSLAFPRAGYRAFYLDLKYEGPNGGKYTKSTRMFVMDDHQIFME
ncbi:PhoPQ-activated protein PqaA family protein [Fulvivirgaceae bacterium BMA12]|uniref:PhoPQ-activated protein PqaA family protein n=1 Tax=Agaribacillus aureus TaxID=3051825 RepID=A0ABT8LJD6_9BACT|nr:PhoPQ-activated protein PqaA family protein [Fulvivirgaceae bacterium BMA12]